jgi:capsular exopolysaccharide synthesis family protein
MSRIDQALKRREAANRNVSSDAATAAIDTATSLDQYSQEGRHPTSLQTPHRSGSGESTGSGQRASIELRTVTAVSALQDNDELRARLVTGSVSKLSIEQYRRLAAVLHEEQVRRQLKTVMITSAAPHEGKTLTVINLALTLSESYGRRVLVIDADLRWPSAHTFLNVPNTAGLTDALRDAHHGLQITNVSGALSIVTAGHAGATPLAGLTSPRMAEVIEDCATRFDWVLLDTPPVGMLPDAQVLARLVGGVIFVIGAGSTPAATVEQAIAELGDDSIIGTVLNRVEERRIGTADYYNQYYSRYSSSEDPR